MYILYVHTPTYMLWQHFSITLVSLKCVCVYVCYLDLAGSLDVVDGVESLLHRLPQGHNAMISQHQDLNIDIHVE